MSNEQRLPDRAARRLDNCTFAKTVLMMLIVVYHSIAFWTGTWFSHLEVSYPSKILDIAAQWFHSSYAFTLVSGYIFYCLKFEKGKYDHYGKFLVNKLKRLVLPCCFVTAVWVGPITASLFKSDLKDIILKYVLGTKPGQLWFLWMLFWIFVIIHPLADFMKKHDLAGGIIAVLFYLVGVVGTHFIPNFFRIFDGCKYFIVFWLGFEIRKYDDKLGGKVPIWFWIILEAVLFAGSVLLPLSGIASDAYNFVWHFIGAASLFEILLFIGERVNWKNSKVFSFLTKRSMVIYLFHQQLIYFTLIWLNGVVNPYINAAANFAFCLLGSIIIGSILMKFKVTRFLIGEK